MVVRADLVATVALLALLAPVAAAPAQPEGAPKYVATASKQLARLPVRPAAAMTGYSRDQFGPAWADVDRNHCDTRDDILRRDLKQVTLKPGSACVVASGVIRDPYTGKKIRFVRGPHSADVQIDHVVALGDAWRTGAATWTASRRLAYANSRLVLLAVDGPANEAKGDGDASEWLPPRSAFRCRYVARQVSIKTRYRLWVTPSERSAISQVLDSCT